MADPFVVPRADYSWLSQLPQQFAQGEALGRESAMRQALSKVPMKDGQYDFQSMAQAMMPYNPELSIQTLAADEARKAREAYQLGMLGLEGAKASAQYPWMQTPTVQAQPQTTQAAQQSAPQTVVPKPRNKAEYMADQKYAEGDYLTWLQGGFSETEQSLKALDHARSLLKNPNTSLGDPAIVGAQVKKSMSGKEDLYTVATRKMYPEAFNIAAAHQRAVVSSLRPLVGARAAQQLFQSIMQTTYDPMANPEENYRRLGLVMDNIKKAAEAKQKMAEYFRDNQTLSGYQGPKFDPSTFDPTEGIDETGVTVRKVQTTPISAPEVGQGNMPPIPEAVGKARRAFEMGHSLADIKKALETDKTDPKVIDQIMQALQGGPNERP